MDSPHSVIGTSTSHQQNQDQDLYEYDTSASRGIADRVRQLINTKQQQSSSNRLLVPKVFYFFFFAAFGSLFPLMAIYFKQMAMSPTQVGILFGFRPFVEFLSVPFWANCAERWKRSKTVLLFSISCWVLFTLGVGFIQPPVHSCLMHNETHIFFEKKGVTISEMKIKKREVLDLYHQEAYLLNPNNEPFLDLMLRKKKQINTNIYRIENVTRIISIRKTKPYKTSLTTSYFNEIEFDLKTIKSIVNTPFNEVRADLVTEIIKDANKMEPARNESKKKVEEIVDNTINDLIQSKIISTSIKTTISKASAISTTSPSKPKIKTPQFKSKNIFPMIDFNLLNDKATVKQNYFDLSSLDSTKYKGKKVYLNDTELKLIKPSLKTSIVYAKQDVNHIFLVFLFFILAGEFFSAPAITLADTCTLQYLGPQQADLYGRQRMYGSLGWGLAMFIICFLLDNAHEFTDHPCGKAGPDERNYSVCFTIYSILMTIALVVATQFQFNYGDDEQIPLKSFTKQIKTTVNQVRGSKYQQFDSKKFVNESDDEQNEPSPANQNTLEQDIPQYDESFTEETSVQKYKRLFRLCSNFKHLVFLFMIWFMGMGVGLVFTFLFWHLQDLGGSPSLYGIASIANHISELIAYFFVHDIVAKFGHVKIFYAGLAGNTVRFIYVSLIAEPYWILPFEFIQGITHALVWAAATSYFAQSVPSDLRPTAQGLLQGLHFGLGRGCGAVFGGILISIFGARLTFFLYGMFCLFTFVLTVGVTQFNMSLDSNQKDQKEFNMTEDVVVNVVNPIMQDTNYYYQSSEPNQDPNGTQVKLFVSPHGVPSTNPNWTRQFKNM